MVLNVQRWNRSCCFLLIRLVDSASGRYISSLLSILRHKPGHLGRSCDHDAFRGARRIEKRGVLITLGALAGQMLSFYSYRNSSTFFFNLFLSAPHVSTLVPLWRTQILVEIPERKPSECPTTYALFCWNGPLYAPICSFRFPLPFLVCSTSSEIQRAQYKMPKGGSQPASRTRDLELHSCVFRTRLRLYD